MDVDVILCNHAEALANQLFLTGGGVNMCIVAPAPPHLVTVALGAVVHVPYQATNQAHKVRVTLVDSDENPVMAWLPDGSPPAPPIQIESEFNVGRPPIIEVGDEQTMALAMNFNNLPMSALGYYNFVVEIDGHEERRLPFRVMTPKMGMPMVMPPQLLPPTA
jgi:hypothetical protein